MNYYYPMLQQPYMQQQYMNQPQQQPQQYQLPQPTIYGKVVDNIDMVKIQEVPLGQTGVYPQADGSSVYIKSWNLDGTTRIDEYQKVSPIPSIPDTTLSDIYSSIQELDKKVESLKQSTNAKKKKMVEVDEDD